MYGYIYLTTNLLNGKKYIGRHKSETFDLKYKGSGKIICNALQKEGWDNFTCNILYECNSEEELNNKEAYYIDLYNAVQSKDFYNLKPGGLGKSEKGKIFINKDNKQFKIYPYELESYLTLGFTKGRLPRTPQAVELTRIKNIGKKRTTETKQKLRESRLGKKASALTREKLRKAHLGKPSNKKGKITIYHPILDKQSYIFENELGSYLKQGWEKRGKPKHKNFSKLVSNTKKGTIIINNGILQKYIKPNDFEKYESLGYIKGKLPKYCKNKYKM